MVLEDRPLPMSTLTHCPLMSVLYSLAACPCKCTAEGVKQRDLFGSSSKPLSGQHGIPGTTTDRFSCTQLFEGSLAYCTQVHSAGAHRASPYLGRHGVVCAADLEGDGRQAGHILAAADYRVVAAGSVHLHPGDGLHREQSPNWPSGRCSPATQARGMWCTVSHSTLWMAAQSSGPMRMALVPLSMTTLVAATVMLCPLTLTPLNATVQYLMWYSRGLRALPMLHPNLASRAGIRSGAMQRA